MIIHGEGDARGGWWGGVGIHILLDVLSTQIAIGKEGNLTTKMLDISKFKLSISILDPSPLQPPVSPF